MDKYEIGRIIGEGQFGRVVQATTIASGTPVAIKQIDVPQPEALPHPVAREALLSTRLSHPHLVRTIEVFPSGRSLMIVMELCQTDLHHYLQHTPPTSCIPHGRTRLLIKMLLSALAFLHSNGILHRDVKPSNCLLDHFGMLKLGDFGLSRFVDEDMSHEVATRWYRAPELILGARNYDGSVDVWSAGCVFAELLRSRSGPIFCGDGDISQLSKIYDVLGTPDLHGMAPPETSMVQFESRNGCGLRRLLPCASDSAVSLLSALLQLDPRYRPTANEALMHPFFTSTDA